MSIVSWFPAAEKPPQKKPVGSPVINIAKVRLYEGQSSEYICAENHRGNQNRYKWARGFAIETGTCYVNDESPFLASEAESWQ